VIPHNRPVSLFSETRAVLRTHGLHPQRSRGQNFLVDPEVRDRILEAAELAPGCQVVEIGSGTGVLTEGLLRAGAQVLAVELDRGLAAALQTRLGGNRALRVLAADALRVDLGEALGVLPRPGAARVVANIPYIITSPLVLRLLERTDLFESLLLTVQREVAERMAARPGVKAYGAFTVACQYRARVTPLLVIPPTAFYPVPEVESALVRLDLRAGPAVTVRDPERFFRVVRAAFGQRRKTLRNALCGGGWGATSVDAALTAADIRGARRGETLSLQEFARLSDTLVSSPASSAGQPAVAQEPR
jgi:16S rRNA (adenine1518-N6/adenine1519-N6)-dimethyltransferase